MENLYRIISISMVKNEQDIIEPFIRVNRQLVDCMVIVDNASVDRTREIAIACAKETDGIVIVDGEGFEYNQSERMTNVMNACQSAYFADFIIFIDVDEFIGAPNRRTLESILTKIPRNGFGLVPWETYVLHAERTETTVEAPAGMIFKRRHEMPVYHKAVLRLDKQYRPDLVVMQGNHSIFSNADLPLAHITLDDLVFKHFPVRSYNQLISKCIVGWMAYLAKSKNAQLQSNGFHWKDNFDKFLSGEIKPTSVCEISAMYAQSDSNIDWRSNMVLGDPPNTYKRLYSDCASGAPLEIVSRSWEQSLRSMRNVFEMKRPVTVSNRANLSSTAFDNDWHWNNLFIDVAPFRFLSELLSPRTVLDVGCGIGAYLQVFKQFSGSQIFGIDGLSLDAVALDIPEYLYHDLTTPFRSPGGFDLVLCTEVCEHIDDSHSETVLNTITDNAIDIILFSAAGPGQPGNGHINCQPMSHWLERFSLRGWQPSLLESLSIRAISNFSWFRRNLIVFRRASADQGHAARAALIEISNLPFEWYYQPPSIRQFAFGDVVSVLTGGYAYISSTIE